MKNPTNKAKQTGSNTKAQTDTTKKISPSNPAIKEANEKANKKTTKADKIERNTNVDQE